MQGRILPCIPDSHPQTITSTEHHINTVVSPDDGHIFARNMQRLINILRINCTSHWLYSQDCAEFSSCGSMVPGIMFL